MLRDKVTEFYVELDDFLPGFCQRAINCLLLPDHSVKRRNRQGKFSFQPQDTLVALSPTCINNYYALKKAQAE
jgi:hypothetical protein